jgi:8-oxo-dGTP pyrophosphatase MutT (NUDIX family)
VELIEHPPSVVIVAVDGDELVLVRQKRPGAAGERTLELPSGKIEPGETPHEAAARELAEECGLAAREWRELGTFWCAPAYSTELVHVFEANGLGAAGPAELDDDEDVEVERRALDDRLDGLSDAASIAALALWRERRGGVRG